MKQSKGTDDTVDIVAFTLGDDTMYTGSSFAYSLKLSFQKVSNSWHACSVKLTVILGDPARVTMCTSVLMEGLSVEVIAVMGIFRIPR